LLKLIASLSVGLLLSMAPVAASPAAKPASAILVVGDSISAGYGLTAQEGWVALLQNRLKSQGYGYRVANASVSGETTTGGLARLPRALSVHRPAIVGASGAGKSTLLALLAGLDLPSSGRVLLAGQDLNSLEPGMIQADGLHPTAKAQPMMLDTMWPALKPLLTR